MLSGLPETDLPFLLPVVIFLHYVSITDARSTGRMESCWYWLDGHNHCVEYGKQHPEQGAAPITSADVELWFQTHQHAFEFQVGSQKYAIDFKEMVKRNLNPQTVIKICRSPSAAMSGSRKQDKERQKEHMEKRSPGQEMDERLLFHGMSPSHVPVICEQNFNWRISGTHGTTYGKGSYFARDASYSHQYCPSSIDHHSMFVAQVLVGDFVWGNQVYLRPPTRPGISNRLLDSCVHNRKNPSIFVIFEKHQIYPAYILEYPHSP